MNPEVWGPRFWFMLQTMAMAYPESANTVTQKKYYEFISNIPLFLPNPEFSKHFASLLDEFPVSPYLDSRISFMKWVHFIHNRMNSYLGKPEINFYDSLELYYKHYEPKEIVEKKKYKTRKRQIEMGVMGMLALIILYSSKK